MEVKTELSKTVLLTGSSGGLGRHIALELASKNFNLALHYKEGNENIKKLMKELQKFGVKLSSYKADITKEEEIEKMVNNAVKDFGSIDVLINNAGISIDGVSWKLDFDSWSRVLGST